MKTKTLLASCVAAVGLAPLSLFALDWPQWQGPDRTNVSQETGLLKQWPEGGPKLLWTFKDAGMGYSSPAIVGDRLYTMGAREDKDWLFAVDVKNGQKIWATPIGDRFSQDRGDGPRSTPTVDGDRLFALDGQGNLVCAKTQNGEMVWQKNLKGDLGGQMMNRWGYSESPLVDGEVVVCTPGGDKGTLAALDKNSGAVRWRSKGFTDAAGFSSLVVSEMGGVRQYVQMTGKSVAGVAAKDGRLLWRFLRNSPTAAIPTPICFDNSVYVSSGYGAGCALLKISKEDSSWKADEVYANKNMVNHHGGVVHVGGHFYGYSDGKGWVCQDGKTGEVVWQERSRLAKGSLTCAEGRLYCYSQTDGTAVLVEASPAGWMESGRFTIPQQSKLPRPRSQRRDNIWTHPVVANGKLYLRDQDLLFCYDVSGGR
jgi:outer membrane protein assembly factor BamB